LVLVANIKFNINIIVDLLNGKPIIPNECLLALYAKPIIPNECLLALYA